MCPKAAAPFVLRCQLMDHKRIGSFTCRTVRVVGFQATPTLLFDEAGPALEPGISFFDREDQQDLFKLHLPYLWRTKADVDTLFTSLLNRDARGLEVQSGLVETDWYIDPVNMILRKPTNPVHLSAGQEIAQAILIARDHRYPQYEVAAAHSRLTREALRALAEWRVQHREGSERLQDNRAQPTGSHRVEGLHCQRRRAHCSSPLRRRASRVCKLSFRSPSLAIIVDIAAIICWHNPLHEPRCQAIAR